MENKLIFDLEQQLTNIDIDTIKLDAVIQLKTWQKKMFSLVEKVYLTRLNEIDEIALSIINEIKEKQNQLEQQIIINDKTILLKLQHEIDELKSNIIINQTIPDNFHHFIEQTIHIKRDNENQDDDDDDDLVIIDIDENEGKIIELSTTNSESRISKIINSEPVQQALAISLSETLTRIGTVAATSSTTIAATAIAKTALLTTAYGIGRIAKGTTKKVWSLVTSSNDV
jgi:hypothetical protein